MPRRPRISTGGLAYHVLNRRVGRLPLFESPKDYALFKTILREEDLRGSVQRGRPFASPRWQVKIAKRLGLESTLGARGRPKGSKKRLPTPFPQ
jgi:hypothetical protein